MPDSSAPVLQLLPASEKHCRKCGICQPLDRFPFEHATQKPGSPCKACHAVAMKAFRHSPQHAERIREKERVRSAARRAARREGLRPTADASRLKSQLSAEPGSLAN